MLAAQNPFSQYFDVDGSPLDGGSIYYGTANADPQSSPVAVYWDAAGTQPAAQPIPTLAGYPVRSGTPAAVYVSGDHSLRVLNKRGAQVVYCASVAATSQAMATQNALASSGAGQGAAMVGFDWTLTYSTSTVGWALMTARYNILRYIPTAQWADILAGTSAYDATANIAAALAAENTLTLPPGRIRGEWNLAGLSAKSIIGAGRAVTVLQNVDNTPVITLSNAIGPCQAHRIEHLSISNRDSVAYSTCDGILITGGDTYQQEFNRFSDLQISGFRYGISVTARLIWTSFTDMHLSGCTDGFHCDTTGNVSELTFRNVRFGSNSAYGLYAKKDAGDALSGWKFDGCTFEVNGLNGVRVSGAASGPAGWRFSGCYTEFNATSLAFGATAPYKANIFIDAAICIGISIDACTLYGATGNNPDYGVIITSPNASGRIGPCRAGTYASAFVRVDSGYVIVDPQGGGITSIEGVNALGVVGELLTQITGTLTGCTTAPTGTLRVSVQGNQVTLDFPAIEGTSSSTAATITGLPTYARPLATRTCIVAVKDNGAISLGLAQIDAAGVITLQPSVGGGSFTASGTKGIRPQSITYIK